MKNLLLFLITILLSNLSFGQLTFKVNPSEVKEIKNTNYDRFSYVDIHPKAICGTYFKHSDYNKFGNQWQVETEITLNQDGTCKTRWYNSGYVGRKPKTTVVSGTWGMAVENNKPVTKVKKNQTWFKIILISNSSEKLAYYDRTAYYDWVLADNVKNTSYLQLVFSSDSPVERKN